MVDTFCLELDPNMSQEDWDKFNEDMDKVNQALVEEAIEISKKLGISEDCALDIQYLRTRSRWTQEAEDELVRMDKAGEERPNIYDWP